MGYGRGNCFPIDFEPNGIPFGSKTEVKLSPRSYPIKFERKWKYSFLSAESEKACQSGISSSNKHRPKFVNKLNKHRKLFM